MGEVGQAADAAQETANKALAMLRRIERDGLELDLPLPQAVKEKLAAVQLAGGPLLKILEALEGVKLRVRLGEPPSPPNH